DETGDDKLYARFWQPKMIDGVIRFDRPEDCRVRKFIRNMSVKRFDTGKSFRPVSQEPLVLEGLA
ncbi:MAG: hypothetical protein JOZ62_18355, partial [Acidobacteriaceae bacterium]|nr:hypothetical protein [Acidobacteriaceae bacterium]